MGVLYPEQKAQYIGHTAQHWDRLAPSGQRAHAAPGSRRSGVPTGVRLTGLPGAEFCRRLGPMIGKEKTISGQTLAYWRQGRRPVPLVAFLAACELAGSGPPMIFALAVEEMGGRPDGADVARRL